MNLKRSILAAAAAVLALLATATARADRYASSERYAARRSAYTYVRAVSGEVTVVSKWNGRVPARRNMPISVGDELLAADGARVEIALADGNVLHIGGGTRASFESISEQQGEEDQFSAVRVTEGSVVLTAVGSNDDQVPRIDTEEATVYVSAGSRVRVNADPRRGTVVIGRAGSAEVRTSAGTTTLRAGQYAIVRGDEEPQIASGAFSRDRFDIWCADRLEGLYETRSASARYVDEQYADDVVALDGYGDWDYSSTYSSNVWYPRVAAGWSPYSYGSWYYTPIGLSWCSYDPWGWFPHHYGNWFFDIAFNRWGWSPAYAYSPAWVYWGYTPSYVGWCPIGFYSPWYDNSYRRQGWGGRGNSFIAINGSFQTRQVDFRGWNFVGADRFGATTARMDVIPGSRIADRLGSQMAISSHPIVVNPRDGGVREAIQSHIREAPRVIERAGAGDSTRLAPLLAHERTLPSTTVDALREHTVVADRGRPSGRAATDLAPRGAVVDRSHGAADIGRGEPVVTERGRTMTHEAPAVRGGTDEWRGRGEVHGGVSREAPRRQRAETFDSPMTPSRPDHSEGRPALAPPLSRPAERHGEDWRSRSEIPPARRVIDGALPGRRVPESRVEEAPRRDAPAAHEWRSREVRPETAPSRIERSPAYAAPHAERPPAYSAPRMERPPAYASPRIERAPVYSPPPRVEHAPAYSAPPPPPAPRAEARRESAPAPAPSGHPERGRKEH